MNITQIILSHEQDALNNWSSGNPGGYFQHAAEDVTYFDDIQAQNRKEGLVSVKPYGEILKEMIPPHQFEMVNPLVQVYGESAILSYHYHPFSNEGEPLTKWRASVVYTNMNDEWKMVHAHWTMEKPQE